MRLFQLRAEGLQELSGMPAAPPEPGTFFWLSLGRRELELNLPELQASLLACTGSALLDLHVQDLLNAQLPSHFDTTSAYDMLVFRRLTRNAAAPGSSEGAQLLLSEARRVMHDIDTSPVGFAAFDHLLLSVHPADCPLRDAYAQRLQDMGRAGDSRSSGPRLPGSSADLMLRLVNQLADGYLELRRLLTRAVSRFESELLNPRSRFNDWPVLLEARNSLHLLQDGCEDQRDAVQEWIDALDEWPLEADAAKRRERELLRIRSRDVLEHVERTLGHVRRLQSSLESVVQMHFSALSHRTNSIMRTLTVLTAIFLPLNLITGFFGMNFEFMPLIHNSAGFWWALGLMLAVGFGGLLFFWRKRYLSTQGS